MQLIRHPRCCPGRYHHSVIALGNFDGVHQGHQQVIGTAIAIAKQAGQHAAVMCFEPHPRDYFSPAGSTPFRLTPLRRKVALFKQMGVDLMVVPQFNQRFASLSGQEFVEHVLHEQLRCSHIVVGYDFKFGSNRSGDSSLLRDQGKALGFAVTEMDAHPSPSGEPCSSTTIRGHIRDGHIAEASALLGRNWRIEGRVIRGRQLGRTLGFPTANLALKRLVRPKFGVYQATAIIDGTEHEAIANVGNRPTVDGGEDLLEVHILDGEYALYGRYIAVELGTFIRPEQRFDGVDALRQQITQDIEQCRNFMA